MILHPPIFTLFPYTTLFRSARTRSKGRAGPHDDGGRWLRPAVARGLRRRSRSHRASRRQAREDRKSTRLNSSHQIISYAVFCLKKKKGGDGLPARLAAGHGI